MEKNQKYFTTQTEGEIKDLVETMNLSLRLKFKEFRNLGLGRK